MKDSLDVQVTGKSEAEIAYQLFLHVVKVENVSLFPNDNGKKVADRDYITKAFAECMIAVTQPTYYT